MCSRSTESNGEDKQSSRRRLRRVQVAEFFQQLAPCLLGMEATRGAHYWARVLRAYGHDVRLIAPQFVKPYLKSQKNDASADVVELYLFTLLPQLSADQELTFPPMDIPQHDLVSQGFEIETRARKQKSEVVSAEVV
jgi:transposase